MIRTTEFLYDEAYYKDKYKSWIDGGLSMKNKRIRIETEKKYNFIKQYVAGVQSILIPGCSFGFLVAELVKDGYVVSGFDVSEWVIAHVIEEAKQFVTKMNIKKMNYPESSYDLVAVFDVIEHLYPEELELGVREIVRVADKYILIRTPVPYHDADMSIHDYSKVPSPHHAGHVSIHQWEFWANKFTESGKFEFWFSSIWGRKSEISCEAWIMFRSGR